MHLVERNFYAYNSSFDFLFVGVVIKKFEGIMFDNKMRNGNSILMRNQQIPANPNNGMRINSLIVIKILQINLISQGLLMIAIKPIINQNDLILIIDERVIIDGKVFEFVL